MKRILSLTFAAALMLPSLALAGPRQVDATNTTAAVPDTVLFRVKKPGFYIVQATLSASLYFIGPVHQCVIGSLSLTRDGVEGGVTLTLQQGDPVPEVWFLQLKAGDVLSAGAQTVYCSSDIEYSLHVAAEEFAPFKR